MKFADIEASLATYEEVFEDFASSHRLPKELFAAPDHFAIKCADSRDYVHTLGELRHTVRTDTLQEICMDERYLASGKMVGFISLAGYEFKWVEIMQPRPGKELPQGFVEHVEFETPDLFQVSTILDRHGISYEAQSNDGHAWLNVVMDSQGREIKFNDKSLEKVTEQEAEEGKLIAVDFVNKRRQA